MNECGQHFFLPFFFRVSCGKEELAAGNIRDKMAENIRHRTVVNLQQLSKMDVQFDAKSGGC